jgi:hypothetical protein
MKVFTIENGTNNITVHGTVQEAEAVENAECFRSEAGLEKLAADWPMVKLVEIWNSLTGVAPVTKFKDRATGVTRIWKQIQNLAPAVTTEIPVEPAAEHSQPGQPEQTESSNPEAPSVKQRETSL